MAGKKMTTDVIFVGGGSAGLSGAVRARELGLKTLVVEKLGSCGGDAMIAAGFWLAAETKYQKEKGVADSKDALYRYFMDYSSYRCRPDLIRVLVDRAAANIEWLEKQGLQMSKEIHVQGPTTVPRVHQNEGMGAQYVKTMKERAAALGAEFLLKTGVKRLIMETIGLWVSWPKPMTAKKWISAARAWSCVPVGLAAIRRWSTSMCPSRSMS